MNLVGIYMVSSTFQIMFLRKYPGSKFHGSRFKVN